MGIREGLMLREYVDMAPERIQESKLKAQLFDAQAKHLEADSALKNMEMQRQMEYMKGLRQEFAANQMAQSPSQPALPDQMAQQPAGPHAQMTVGQLHDTESFKPDFEDHLLTIQSRAAARAGMVKEATQVQQALLERQKVKTAQRTQQLQDKLGMLQTIASNLPPTPEFAGQRETLRQAMAATMFQIGKTNDAIQFLEGKILALHPGGTAIQVKPGESTGTTVAQSPINPVAIEGQKEAERNRVRYGAPPGTTVTQPMLDAASEDARLRTRLGKTVQTPQSPSAVETAPQGQKRFTANIDGQEALIDAKDEAGAQAILRQAYPGRLFKVSEVTEGPAAQLAGQEAAARRKETQIPREAAEQLEVPIGTTYGQLESGQIKSPTGSNAPKQLPTAKEREDIADYQAILKSVDQLKALLDENPKVSSQLLGSFLLNPKGAFTRLWARQGGKVSPEAREFLARYGAMAAVLRTQLIGLAQTRGEKTSLADYIPGPESGIEGIKGALDAIAKQTTVQRDEKLKTQEGLGVKTPTNIKKGEEGAPKAEKAPAQTAPAQETPQQMLERLKTKGFGKK